jgi:hypothetical protein
MMPYPLMPKSLNPTELIVSVAKYDLVHPELLDDEIQELMASQLQQVPPRPLQQRHLIFTDLPSPGITFNADRIANVIWTRADLVLIGNIIIFRMSYIHTETHNHLADGTQHDEREVLGTLDDVL